MGALTCQHAVSLSHVFVGWYCCWNSRKIRRLDVIWAPVLDTVSFLCLGWSWWSSSTRLWGPHQSFTFSNSKNYFRWEKTSDDCLFCHLAFFWCEENGCKWIFSHLFLFFVSRICCDPSSHNPAGLDGIFDLVVHNYHSKTNMCIFHW